MMQDRVPGIWLFPITRKLVNLNLIFIFVGVLPSSLLWGVCVCVHLLLLCVVVGLSCLLPWFDGFER